MEKVFCDICGEALTPQNKFPAHVTHYRPVCNYHQMYAVMQTPTVIIKNNLGIAPYPDNITCDVCNSPLNKADIAALDYDRCNITCQAHNDVKKWNQLDIGILWFRYKQNNPEAVYELHSETKDTNSWNYKFHVWYGNLSHAEYSEILNTQFPLQTKFKNY